MTMRIVFPRFRRVRFDDVSDAAKREFFSRDKLSRRDGWIRVRTNGALYIVNKHDQWYEAKCHA